MLPYVHLYLFDSDMGQYLTEPTNTTVRQSLFEL